MLEGPTIRDKLLRASKIKTEKRLADVLTRDKRSAFSGSASWQGKLLSGGTTLNSLTPRRWLRQSHHDAIALAPGQRLIEVFRQGDMAGRLLIMGEPGSGRTTALLELVRDLLTVAATDEQAPVPLMVELSSWTDERQALGQWLGDRLWVDYSLSRQQSRELMATHQILPVLDGLDELEPMRQQSCFAQLNQLWPEDEPDRQGIVCGYSPELDLPGAKLTKLNRTVELRPLLAAQIQAYLAEMVCPDLWAKIQASPELRQLATKPLMLALMPVALAHRPAQTQAELFTAYVQARFDGYEQERGQLPYSREQTLNYLGWLARQMRAQHQTVLLIEGIQPTWLRNQRHQRAYRRMVGLMAGGVVGLLTGMVFGWIVGQAVGLIVGLLAGLIFGLIYGPLFGRIFGPLFGLARIRPVERLRFSFSDFPMHILYREIQRGPVVGLAIGRFIGITLGLILGLILLLVLGLAGLLAGPIFGLTLGLMVIWIFQLLLAPIIGPMVGLVVGLVIGLVVAAKTDITTRNRPNQGIWVSAQNALFSAVLGLGIAALLYVSLGWLLPLIGVEAGWVNAIIGAAIALTLSLCTLIGGGLACIQHLALRWVLWRRGVIPWNYARFLRHGADLQLLRQTGGEFRFFHDLLRSHIAANLP